MVFNKYIILAAVLVFICVSKGKNNYRNYKVVRTQPLKNVDAIRQLLRFEGQEGISFWKYPTIDKSVDIMVSPEKLFVVEEILSDLGLEHKTVIEDVQKLIEDQNDAVIMRKQAESIMSWDQYHRYDVITNYAKDLADKNEMVSYQVIGNSSEGREIGLVTISSRGNGSKPAVFLDGGAHGREWISPAVVTYMMHKLITNNEYRDLVDTFDWFIVPVINPDGYEYTHTHDRMWYKTRSRHNGTRCYGTDANANWDFQWGGSSFSDPCSNLYKGPHAFSEPETKAVADAIMARRNQIKLYVTFHSYGEYWFIPWTYTRYRAADYKELHSLASTGARALREPFGTRYNVGQWAQFAEFSLPGGSSDWAKGYANITYSYHIELRDRGTYGFTLPASQIQPTGEEMLRGVAAVARELKNAMNPAG